MSVFFLASCLQNVEQIAHTALLKLSHFLENRSMFFLDNLKEELPQYLASKSLPTGNLSHQSQTSTVDKVESTDTGLTVKHKAVVLDELKRDLKKGTNPLKSAANMMTKAGQLCSTDFLSTEEWHNFIREVASHEAMTRDDVEYLRASKDIYEGQFSWFCGNF